MSGCTLTRFHHPLQEFHAHAFIDTRYTCACAREHTYVHAPIRSFTSLPRSWWWTAAQRSLPSALDTERSHCNVDPNAARLHHQSRSAGQMESKWDTLGPQTDKRLQRTVEAAIVLLWTIAFLPRWVAGCGEARAISCGWQWR